MSTNPLLARLRHHVTGAIERGEKQAIVAQPRPLQVGDYVTSDRLGRCIVRRIHGHGTIDVEDSKGSWFRMSGLMLTRS